MNTLGKQQPNEHRKSPVLLQREADRTSPHRRAPTQSSRKLPISPFNSKLLDPSQIFPVCLPNSNRIHKYPHYGGL
jgi:hypothetical protein